MKENSLALPPTWIHKGAPPFEITHTKLWEVPSCIIITLSWWWKLADILPFDYSHGLIAKFFQLIRYSSPIMVKVVHMDLFAPSINLKISSIINLIFQLLWLSPLTPLIVNIKSPLIANMLIPLALTIINSSEEPGLPLHWLEPLWSS